MKRRLFLALLIPAVTSACIPSATGLGRPNPRDGESLRRSDFHRRFLERARERSRERRRERRRREQLRRAKKRRERRLRRARERRRKRRS